MSRGSIRCLVVEDDPGSRLLLKDILTNRGHEVEACADAETAWVAYQRQAFPLVLLDLKLPGMSGIELCRRIRRVPASAQSVVLFVTAVTKREALEEALEAGANDYVSKPVTSDLLHVRLSIAERQVRSLQARKRTEEELVRDALHDPITDLPNRSLFMERLDRAARRSNRDRGIFSVLYVDLDDFHGMNETFGQEGGDEILREVGRRLDACVRSVDTVARVADDEFAVLLDGLNDVSDPTRVAHRIHHALSHPLHMDGQEAHTSACIGIALSLTGFETPGDVLRDAEKALLVAREEEGWSSHRMFDPVMHARALARVQLESRIREAVESDEMTLFYQPVYSIGTGELRGFEALLRWEDPDRGLILPEEFVPIAEDTGLIVPLGWWVLEKACRQLRDWQIRFPRDVPLMMGVNVSGKQFAQPDLFEQVEARLDRLGIPGQSLHLEITESSIMQNVDSATRTLHRLKDRAVSLDVDDFGTGYSSLSYLCRFPIDTLKIDRSFVEQMTHSPENLEIVRTIVQLARNLGLKLVAEGVETEGQLDRLREFQCESAQGYLFSRPVPAAEAEALLAEPPTPTQGDGTSLVLPITPPAGPASDPPPPPSAQAGSSPAGPP